MQVRRAAPLNLTPQDSAAFARHACIEVIEPAVHRYGPSCYLGASQTLYDRGGKLRPVSVGFAEEAPLFTRSFFWGRWLLQKRVPCTSPLVLIADKYADNYYHWHAEVLPNLLHFLAQPEARGADWQLLIPPSCARLAFVRESLDALVPGRFRLAAVGENFHANEVLFCLKSQPLGSQHPALMQHLATRLHANAAPGEALGTGTRRIYARRTGVAAKKRSIVNDAEVTRLLVRKGFECLDFDGLSYVEQIRLARQTRTLVSIHGAGLTNMAFMPPGSAVYEFQSRSDLLNVSLCFYALANCFGHRYHYQACASDLDHDITGNIGKPKGHLTVDLAALERDLEKFQL